MWFEATRTGTFHLFGAENCGTLHAGMIGQAVVMTPAAYEEWLGGGTAGESPVAAGERLFQQLDCQSCHRTDTAGRGPALAGLFGQMQRLQSGASVLVDEAYVRESILLPNAKVAAGYTPVMATFQGQISEEGLLPNILPKQLYYRVFAALMVLTLITVGVAFVDLGRLNTIIALTIAVGKALLVICFFMHVRYSSRLIWECVGSGFFWLALLLTLAMSDYLTRSWLLVTGW
jgi:caa(3)-type oxidase subunit IV